MIEFVIWSIIFIVSILVLIKASDYFTVSAEKIGLYLGMPSFVVGVTIVAVGTSLPELVSSIIAVFKGASEIVVGNVVGSNIANIFLILGFAAFVGKRINTTHNINQVDLPVLVASAFLFSFMIWDKKFTTFEAILLLLGLVTYFFYVTNGHRNGKKDNPKLELKNIVILVVSVFFIYVGAKYTIDSIIKIADILSVGKEIIALSAVALGTSLPELAVSIQAVRKGKAEIAIGNVLGSNIFNTFAVMSIPAFFGTLIIPATIISFALPMMIAATLLFFFMMQEKAITRWEGAMLLIFYVLFIGKILNFL